MGRTVSSVKEAFLELSAAAETMRLKLKERKNNFMQVNSEIIQEFKYLGTIVLDSNNMFKELRNRIILNN